MSDALLRSMSENPVVASERQVMVGNDPTGDRTFLSPELGRDLSRIAMRLLRDTRSVLEYIFPIIDVGQTNQFFSYWLSRRQSLHMVHEPNHGASRYQGLEDTYS